MPSQLSISRHCFLEGCFELFVSSHMVGTTCLSAGSPGACARTNNLLFSLQVRHRQANGLLTMLQYRHVLMSSTINGVISSRYLELQLMPAVDALEGRLDYKFGLSMLKIQHALWSSSRKRPSSALHPFLPLWQIPYRTWRSETKRPHPASPPFAHRPRFPKSSSLNVMKLQLRPQYVEESILRLCISCFNGSSSSTALAILT